MLSNRQHYPELIILSANVTDESLQAGMEYLLSGAAEPGCKIRLNDNFITPPQLNQILNALADERCPPGVEIFFDNCHFTDAYANKFAELFAAGRYPANMRLHFHGNSIGDDGLFAMLDALSRDGNHPGVFLNMQYNHHLSNECVDALTALIAHNQLADGVGIDLRNNPALGDAERLRLLNSLQRNTAVTVLKMEIPYADFNDDGMADGEIGMTAMIIENQRRSQLEFCCARNRLLQQYRGNPDLIYQIHRLSAARGYPLPCPPAIENAVPSLRFFAANTVPPAALQAFFSRFEGGFEGLRELTDGMQNNTNQLDPDSKKHGCPWSCTML